MNNQMELEDEDIQIQRISLEVSKQLDKTERDRILLEAMRLESDDLKIAILKVLNVIPIEQYDFDEIKEIWGRLKNRRISPLERLILLSATTFSS
jgi:hypothetical protein